VNMFKTVSKEEYFSIGRRFFKVNRWSFPTSMSVE
jgi:hypothetical protein